MTPKRRANLERLLKPRHVAVIGGRDAETVAAECKRIGFSGPFWPVNPKRSHIGGHPCFASIDALPEGDRAALLLFALEELAHLAQVGWAERDGAHRSVERNTESLADTNDIAFGCLLESVAAGDDAHIVAA